VLPSGGRSRFAALSLYVITTTIEEAGRFFERMTLRRLSHRRRVTSIGSNAAPPEGTVWAQVV